MLRPRPWIVVAGLVALVTAAASTGAAPINGGVDAPTPDVFYNFYVPPVPAGPAPGFGAQLYVAPRPVPPADCPALRARASSRATPRRRPSPAAGAHAIRNSRR